VKRIATVLLALTLLIPAAGNAVESIPLQEAPVTTVAAAPTKKLDINRATLAELVAVPGLGSRTAQAIIDLRSKKGSFSKLDELLEVRGIKEKKLAQLSAHLTVSPGKPQAQPPAAPTSR
jgi:competence ComEA-like helix-hairpin-helix protein